jgi:hypothetical protein
MSIIYLVLLLGVALVILFVMADAAISVSRKPVWEQRDAQRSTLQLVQTVDHRSQDLPFVGADRRKAVPQDAELQDEAQRRVA